MPAKNLVILERSFSLKVGKNFTIAEICADVNSRGIGINRANVQVILSEMEKLGLVERSGRGYQITQKGVVMLDWPSQLGLNQN